MTQLLLLDLPTTEAKPRKDSINLLTDMWGQPASCPTCGKPNTRKGAYLTCRQGHEQWIELHGRPDHPMHEQYLKYRRSIGHPID